MSVQLMPAARRAAVAWSVLTLGLCVVGARADDAPPPARRTASRAAVRSNDAGAAKALESRCARCHDADGSGRSSRERLREIPDFNSHKWQESRTDAALLVSILDGKGSHMPGFRGKVGDDEARALVASVRAFDPEPPARRAGGAPDDFERRFRELQEELADLKKQFREVSAPRRKP